MMRCLRFVLRCSLIAEFVLNDLAALCVGLLVLRGLYTCGDFVCFPVNL